MIGLNFNTTEVKMDIFYVTSFIVCVLFHQIQVFSIISLVLLYAYILMLLREYPIFFLKNIAILFEVFGLPLACFAIEFCEAPLPELRDAGRFIGSIPLLVLTIWVLVRTIVCIDKRYMKNYWNTERFSVNRQILSVAHILNALALGFNTFCLLRVIHLPAFLLAVDRFAYSNMFGVNEGFIGAIANRMPFLIIGSYILIALGQKKSKIMGTLSVVVFLLYRVWIGEKFGTIFFTFCTIAIFMFLKLQISNRLKGLGWKVAILGVISSVLVFTAIYMQAVVLGTFGGDIIYYAVYRIAAQGQLYWKIFDLFGMISPHIMEIGDELAYFGSRVLSIKESLGLQYGIYKIMYLCAPHDIVNGYLSNGVRFAESGYASALYYFGAIGPLFYAFLFGVTQAIVVNELLIVICEAKLIRVFVLIRLLTLIQVVFTMSQWNNFFTPFGIFLFLVLLILYKRNVFVNIGRSCYQL